jgi:ribosomal protein S18 acetylase RimI-like enzyme
MRRRSIQQIRLEDADPRRPGVAEAIHSVQMAAYAQEAALLGVSNFPPLSGTVEEVRSGWQAQERYVAAFIGNEIVGAIGIETGEVEAVKWMLPADRPQPHVHIASLVVAPAHRRCGIGRRLVERVIAECGDGLLTVSTAVGNGPAIALYAALGFTERGRRLVGDPPIEIVLLERERP